MEYKSKGYVFDEDVTAWLDKLKSMHGSYNKGLRLVAFTPESIITPEIEGRIAAQVKPRRLEGGTGVEIRPDPRPEPDGVMGTILVDAKTKSATVNVRSFKSALLKPKDRKK